MSVFRIEKTKDFTIMSNHHLRNRNLTLKAKGLMSLMLSLPEEWDYTLKGLSLISKEGVDAIRVAVLELEQQGYVVRERIRNEKGQLGSIEYVIHEFPVEPKLKKPILENPMLDNPKLGEPMLEEPALENPTQLNTNKSNKKELKTDYIKNPSINQREPEQYGEDIEQNNQRWIDKYNDAVEEIKENIEYDCFLSDRDKPLIDEIVKIMAEVLTMNTPYYTIEGKQYPAELVKQRFREVTNENLQSFLLEFNRHTEKIYNPKAYLITSLFNMPATADTVLTNMVKSDMAQGGF